MKKLAIFLLSGLVALSAKAQVKVILLRDTTAHGVSPAALDKQHPSLTSLFQSKPKVAQEAIYSAHKQFETYIKNRKDIPKKGFYIALYEYYQPDGKAQWVFVQPDRPLADSVQTRMLSVLKDFYSTTAHSDLGNVPFRVMQFMGYGQTVAGPRTVRRGSGIISTVEAAQKTTRPDTVKMLAFNQLDLANVPEVVYRFPNLEELDLSKNNLHELPARLTADIPTLQRLSVLYNAIPNDSVFITRNKHLISLNLQGNKLTQIPASVRLNRRLESLWMGNNKLAKLTSKQFRGLRRLTDLNLYNAGLTQLPKGVGRIKRLTVLDLYYNKFTELPKQLSRLKKLEQLAIAHNDLKEINKSLAKLRRLQVLYAHHNRISQLPAELQQLKNLRTLDLGYNWFSTAPAVLSALPNLEELDLNNNNLQEFPTVLLSIRSLKKVYLGSNPLWGREGLQSPYAAHIKQLEANNTQVTY